MSPSRVRQPKVVPARPPQAKQRLLEDGTCAVPQHVPSPGVLGVCGPSREVTWARQPSPRDRPDAKQACCAPDRAPFAVCAAAAVVAIRAAVERSPGELRVRIFASPRGCRPPQCGLATVSVNPAHDSTKVPPSGVLRRGLHSCAEGGSGRHTVVRCLLPTGLQTTATPLSRSRDLKWRWGSACDDPLTETRRLVREPEQRRCRKRLVGGGKRGLPHERAQRWAECNVVPRTDTRSQPKRGSALKYGTTL